MNLDTLRRPIASMSRLAGALMLCALPALAQDEESEAAPAQQGGHYEAGQGDGQAETEEAPAPIPQPAARPRTVPRVFRARPAGSVSETNQEAASPAVEEGQSIEGGGLSQGAADEQVGQGSGSSSGRGDGSGGPSGRPLGSSHAPAYTDAAGNYHYAANTHIATPFSELPGGPKSFAPTMNCEIKDLSTLPPGATKIQKERVAAGEPAMASYSGGNLRWKIPRHGCLAVKFKTGLKKGYFDFALEEDPIARLVASFINVSRNPGDFDYANVEDGHYGSVGTVGIGVLAYTIIDQPVNPGIRSGVSSNIKLRPNTIYYLNIRAEAVSPRALRGIDGCTYGGNCGGVYQIHYVEDDGWNSYHSAGLDRAVAEQGAWFAQQNAATAARKKAIIDHAASLPSCGGDWESIGTLECRDGVQWRRITSCKPPGYDDNSYANHRRHWDGPLITSGDMTTFGGWMRATGKSCQGGSTGSSSPLPCGGFSPCNQQ